MHLKRQASSGFKPINANAAGIDIGAQTHWVCIPVERAVENVGSFGCFTAGLYALADWLKECGIQTATMESTGFTGLHYFRSLKLVALRSKCVNTHHVKTLPGRKSDVLDCQWSQPLHSYGLCSASFRPDDEICVIRSYIRQRDNLVRSARVHGQRMQKALTEINVQLHQVVSDITARLNT